MLLAWALPTPATATSAPAPASLQLQVHAPPSCATPASLMARVRARVPHVRFVSQRAPLRVQVTLQELDSGTVIADVLLLHTNHQGSRRRLRGRSCEEASEGAALIIAITLGAAAEATGAPADAGSPATPLNRTTEALPGAAAVEAGASRPAPWAERSWELGILGAGAVWFGPAPGVMPALGASVSLRRLAATSWRTALFIGGVYAWGPESRAWGGTASFALAAGNLEACPWLLRVAPGLEIGACGSALAGRFSATGSETRNPAGTVHRPFVALGASALVSWLPGAALQVSLQWSSRANLIRDEFVFQPRTFHRVGSFTHAASLGAGWRW